MQGYTCLEITHSQPAAATQKIGHSQEEVKKKSWWKKALDMEEAKTQMLFAMPMIFANLFYYFIPIVSVMIAGHLGDLELASATLANCWATVSGFAFMIGLSGALETLCGQGFGAKMYQLLGLYLQASCIISFACAVIISILWLFTETIMVTLHQDPEISKIASGYMKYLIPGIFAYGFLQNVMRFLQAQAIVKPLVLSSLVCLPLNVGIAYALVNWTTLGVKGASLAVSVTLWISFLMLAIYVHFSKRFHATWNGFSLDSLYLVVPNLRLAIPSAAMVGLEYMAFEILVLLAGVMPDSERNTSIIAICTRVSNALGAGHPERAKNAISVSLKLSIMLALIVAGALACGNKVWAGFFSSSPSILNAVASLVPYLAVSIILDSIQGVLSGVARGCGWQLLVVYVNMATFYFVGVTSAVLLAFKLKLYDKGLWIGLTCGLFCQAATLLLVTLSKNWRRLDLLDNQ